MVGEQVKDQKHYFKFQIELYVNSEDFFYQLTEFILFLNIV